MSKIRIAVSGYGNLGRGVFAALRQNPDMEPVALFTRRDPASIAAPAEGVPVVSVSEMAEWKDAQIAAQLTKLQGYEDDTPLTDDFFERNGFYKDYREETEVDPYGEIWCYRTPNYRITAENFDEDWLVQASGSVFIETIGQLRMYLTICGYDDLINKLK